MRHFFTDMSLFYLLNMKKIYTIMFLFLPMMVLAYSPSNTIYVTNEEISTYSDQFIGNSSSQSLYNRSGRTEMEKMILDTFGTDDALKIAFCESGLNPNAIGDKNTTYQSYGLFQIRGLPGRPDPNWLLNPENNIQYAYELYLKEGWQPWTCARILGIL